MPQKHKSLITFDKINKQVIFKVPILASIKEWHYIKKQINKNKINTINCCNNLNRGFHFCSNYKNKTDTKEQQNDQALKKCLTYDYSSFFCPQQFHFVNFCNTSDS